MRLPYTRVPAGWQTGCHRDAFGADEPGAARRGARRQIRILSVNLAVRVGRVTPISSPRFSKNTCATPRANTWRCGAATRARPAGHAPGPGPRTNRCGSAQQITSQRPCPRSGYETVTGRADWGDAGPGQAGKPVSRRRQRRSRGVATRPVGPDTSGQRAAGRCDAPCGDDHPLGRWPGRTAARGAGSRPGQRPTTPAGRPQAKKNSSHGHRPGSTVGAVTTQNPTGSCLTELPTAFRSR